MLARSSMTDGALRAAKPMPSFSRHSCPSVTPKHCTYDCRKSAYSLLLLELALFITAGTQMPCAKLLSLAACLFLRQRMVLAAQTRSTHPPRAWLSKESRDAIVQRSCRAMGRSCSGAGSSCRRAHASESHLSCCCCCAEVAFVIAFAQRLLAERYKWRPDTR